MPEADAALLAEAASEAGALALRLRREGITVKEKPDAGGPVTNADLAVDALLHERLTAARPDYGWLSEETPDLGARRAARLAARRVFIIDPIDGTRAFIDGRPEFALSLAVAEDGRVIAGVIALPALGAVYVAALGAGAMLNGAAIAASPASQLAGARMLVNKRQMAAALWPGGVPPVRPSFRPSLAYRLALVADGQFDAMVCLRDAWEWDVAAGALIAAEAGAAVSARGGAPLVFNNGGATVDGIIAAPATLHAALVTRATGPAADEAGKGVTGGGAPA